MILENQIDIVKDKNVLIQVLLMSKEDLNQK